MRDEFLNGEIFDNVFAVEVLNRKRVIEYNAIRPHSSLGYQSPSPQAILIVS
jgi:putative transposase